MGVSQPPQKSATVNYVRKVLFGHVRAHQISQLLNRVDQLGLAEQGGGLALRGTTERAETAVCFLGAGPFFLPAVAAGALGVGGSPSSLISLRSVETVDGNGAAVVLTVEWLYLMYSLSRIPMPLLW
jgi:hypothetical protein